VERIGYSEKKDHATLGLKKYKSLPFKLKNTQGPAQLEMKTQNTRVNKNDTQVSLIENGSTKSKEYAMPKVPALSLLLSAELCNTQLCKESRDIISS